MAGDLDAAIGGRKSNGPFLSLASGWPARTPPAGGKMLKLIDPGLNADVLHALKSMGHGDELVLCDTNFPADSVARHTVLGRLLHLDNVSAARAAKAILSLMPLDNFVDQPALRMEIAGAPNDIPPVQIEVDRKSVV